MATFEARVEGLTGLSLTGSIHPTQTQVTEYLKDGVIEVTDRCLIANPQDARLFQTVSSEQTSDGSYTVKGRIISVIRESGTGDDWRLCREIPVGLQSRVVDPDSLEYCTKRHPAYMVEDNGKISVFPIASVANAGFKVTYISNDPENDAESTLAHDSSDIRNFPKSKVYLVVLYASIKTMQMRLHTMDVSESNLPADISTIVLESTSESLPTYTAPSSFAMPVVPAGADVDFSSVGSIEDFVPPVISLSSAPSISDLSVSVVPPVAPVLSDTSISFSTTAPTFVPPITSPDYADANTWINTEEDDEMLAARVQLINSQIDQYGVDIQNATAAMNKQNLEYQAQLQIAIQGAQLDSQDDVQKIQKYQAELTEYNNNVNKETAEYGQNLTKEIQLFQTKRQTELTKYGSDTQKERERVNASLTNFQAEVNKAIQEYQSESGYDLSKYQGQVQAEVQRYQNDLADASATFNNSLGKYEKEYARVTSVNQTLIGKYTIEVQNYAAHIQKATKKYEWMTGRMMKLQQEYDTAFAIMQPKQQQQGGR